VISEDAALLDESTQNGGLDVTRWHKYSMEWTAARATMHVDDALVLDTPVSPRGPMGIVIWIDNQHAGFHPQGKLTFGLEANPEPAWLEIRDLSAA
jgi:hypothetical protein